MKKTYGFTIVELLIVIVVIGILAAISIVAYKGINDRATDAAVIHAMSNYDRLLAQELAAAESVSDIHKFNLWEKRFVHNKDLVRLLTKPGNGSKYAMTGTSSNHHYVLVVASRTKKCFIVHNGSTPREIKDGCSPSVSFNLSNIASSAYRNLGLPAANTSSR